MALILALAVAVLVVLFVAAPFILGTPRREEARGAGGSERAGELLAQKEALYAAIQELDCDLASGKLSAADHRALRERYEGQAAALLKRIDELTAGERTEEARTPAEERRKG